MFSNFRPIKKEHANWLNEHFGCDFPEASWREDVYPTYPAPFIYLEEGKPKCELAQFGLVPHWANDIKKFGLKTYNARSETVQEKPSFRSAWRERRYGLAIMESFYEPNWETGKAVRWRIKRADSEPIAVASIWERFVDIETCEIIFSFSMLTINADNHATMKHFHKPKEEKRSIVVLDESNYMPWLKANHTEAKRMLNLAPDDFLFSEPAPR